MNSTVSSVLHGPVAEVRVTRAKREAPALFPGLRVAHKRERCASQTGSVRRMLGR
jgi:hypothetical protein